jgi:hypothetical protein
LFSPPNGWPLTCGRAGRLPRTAIAEANRATCNSRPASAVACYGMRATSADEP